MTTIEKECRNDGCTDLVRYGIETRPEVTPIYCSFKCRDEAEGLHWHGRTGQ